ncbi:glycine--tRNA ligase subunit beta [Metabacillus sp. GX 13764]|uniref:glycine--tRNA ligase subunit beta n=1 Tax=Metabacillus kandeliae TaxID=2900151 RepID=UPI001E46CB50|nr:glycine--tRNA ligase subunit beta [Metabacillus kandeliae]MCD7033064.1 glycine--tRNA ligase subunit beta [Metabacillus kandeliae]
MSNRDLLIEIGLEELPARFVTDAMNQLGSKLEEWLKEKNLSYGAVSLYSTPRRLAVLIQNAAEKQEDTEEEAKGPAKKIALDAEGNWTKAAAGFARGQGASVEDIYFKEINGVEYVHVQKFTKGKEAKELLPELQAVITSLSFPKNMKWGSYELRYARPIKWMIALFGEEVIPFSITGVSTGRQTEGHLFLGKQTAINSPADYEEALNAEYVMADPEKRKAVILEQLKQLEQDNGFSITVDEELLEEVNNLVEYPTALFGQFDEKFLELPEEVLITSMKEHQRYFPVKSEDGNLLAKFVTVRNGNSEHLGKVAKGNEKVLKARLSDADFFYNEDHKLKLDDALQKLEKIVFHEELGTVGDKVRRTKNLAEKLAGRLNFSAEDRQDAVRTAEIGKFDLVSQMVYEFPELQGIMGEKYARLMGENEAVAKAINEQYMPRHAEDAAPSSNAGALAAVADKLDTVAAFFSIGMVPTGSQDPYALRRQASGIVQILISKNWTVSFEELFDLALEGLQAENKEEAKKELAGFFKMRMKYILAERNIRYDLVDAVLESDDHSGPSLIRRAEVLQEESRSHDFKEIIEALSRVLNIAKKGEQGTVQESLFENDLEKELFRKSEEAEQAILQAGKQEDYKAYYSVLKGLKDSIDAYFEGTMVMAEDPVIRKNRLAFMVRLAALIKQFANTNTILVK